MNVHRVRSAGEPAFDGLLRVYTAAHPASERKSADALRKMMERPEYLFLVVEDSDVVVGFAIAIALRGCDAALLEYLAVDAERRGKGIGRLLFRAIAGWPEAQQRFLLIEVDSSLAPSQDQIDRARRKEFYRRQGCREISALAYLMPPVSSAQPPAMDMLLYRRELPDAVDKECLRGWLAACYEQVYGVPKEDERIEAMLNDLPATIRLV
ncbi:MAG TPA: GNAT family N-acetyltransferase [Terracidiphilus sp.]|jgi:GNAT superfamily N-acetyltransferase